MATVQDLITEFKRTYRTCEDARALAICQEVDEEILLYVPLRMATTDVPLVADTDTYAAAETDLRVWRAHYRTSPARTGKVELTWATEKKLDNDYPGWKAYAAGTPRRFYTTQDTTQGRFGVWPAPNTSTLLVTGATNVSPIVVTTGAHGLASGAQVYISGVTGNTAANGTFYVTVLSPTTFSLYSDAARTVPVAGNGAYVSGGMILCAGSPLVTVDVTRRVVLATNTVMPLLPQIRRLYIDGMCFYYAREAKNPADIALYRPLFEDALQAQHEATDRRDEDVQIEIKTFNQRPNFRKDGIRRSC
jgi:hypothetical protein